MSAPADRRAGSVRGTGRSPRPHGLAKHPRAVIILSLLVLSAATAGLLARIEPFPTFYYFFAWYATIAIVDAWAYLRDRSRPMLLSRPLVLFSLLAWSAVIWFTFELWNLRLENWYYVNVPDSKELRWTGTVIAFATVLPGLFTITRLLETYRLGDGLRTSPFRLTRTWLIIITLVGAFSGALVLAWPRTFFPLVWGVTFFLIAPINYRWGDRGLLREVAEGRWGLVVRLLAAGAICGFLWELFNIGARAKWIYTVPGFEDFKLFEMPLLGFLGFPPFALECYEMYRALVLFGLASEWEDSVARKGLGVLASAGIVLAAAAIVVMSLPLMDRMTVDSMIPRPGDLPAVDEALASRLAELGVTDLAALPELLAEPDSAERLGISAARHTRLADQTELALLRGIGTHNTARLVAVGVGNVTELARTDATGLAGWLIAADASYHPRLARLSVWIRAARARLSGRR